MEQSKNSKKYLCNPVNVSYRYQFNEDMQNSEKIQVAREAVDPSMIRSVP